jgi:predicted amidohydrolase
MPPIKVGVYQGGCARGVNDNIELAERVLTSAAADQIDLVVFSETFLHGYCSGSMLRDLAETQTGPSFQRISKVAAQLKV